jgi:Spy/CpxP family protein refolding chaperone
MLSVCRFGIVAVALLASATAIGCGGATANSAPATEGSTVDTTGDEATADLVEHHRYHHHGGITLFIAMSLDTMGLPPEEQAAVEKIRSDLHARMEPAHAAEQSLVSTLAEGLAAGTLDPVKVDAAVAQVTTAAGGVHEASAEALNQLHATLTPLERAALIDKVESHWAVWQKANAEETGASKPEGRLARLATDLDLTTDQVDKIRSALTEGMRAVPKLDPTEVDAHLRDFGAAFRSDKFDAKGMASASIADAHIVGWGAAHLAHFVEAVAPVLTPDQRAQLAEQLREHASHNPSAQANP